MKFIKVTKKKAQSLIEYALILSMVAVVAIAALQLLGNKLGSALRQASETVGEGADKAGSNACTAMGSEFSWNVTGKQCVYVGGSAGT